MNFFPELEQPLRRAFQTPVRHLFFAIRHDVSDKSNSLRLYELIIIYCYKTEWKHRINENEISSDPGTKIDNLPAV